MGCECERWAEHLFEPEEALTQAEREGLTKHLTDCQECALERAIFLDSWSALEQVDEELEPCPLLRAKVWEKIREEGRCPSGGLPSLMGGSDHSWKGHAIKLAAAAAAIVLGFGMGRALRPLPDPAAGAGSEAAAQENFLDPDLIELASQDGFSIELFPESNQFSPIDRDMMSALATSDESRRWLARERGSVVPLRYISQSLPRAQEKAR
jgi:hypothetical protein